MSERTDWWGDFEIPSGETRRWIIGPMTLWIRRTPEEWRLAWKTSSDPLEDALEVAVPASEEPDEEATIARFAFRQRDDVIRLSPALADRPVVVNTETPFYIPEGNEITLFIGTPLWVQVMPSAGKQIFIEFPIFRPSDTWFGPDTRRGELCYASRTSARVQVENQPRLPHRAISVARIRNQSNSNLQVEKLKLPVQHLSLFRSESGFLYTEALTMQREDESEQASVRLDRNPKFAVGSVSLVSKPRHKISKGFFLQAFGSFFLKRGDKDDARIPGTPGAVASTDS